MPTTKPKIDIYHISFPILTRASIPNSLALPNLSYSTAPVITSSGCNHFA